MQIKFGKNPQILPERNANKNLPSSTLESSMPNVAIKWKDFKRLHHTCDLKGRDSDECRDMMKSLGVKFVDE